MSVSEVLKAIRKEKGLSQAEMGECLHVSRSAIARWEADKGLPDIGNLITIHQIFGVSLDDLVLGNGASENAWLAEQKERDFLEKCRLLSVRLIGASLMVILMTGDLFEQPLLVQVSYGVILMAILMTNRLIAKRLSTSSPTLRTQYFYSFCLVMLTGLAFYRFCVVSDHFSKIIAALASLIFFVLTALTLWGVRYVNRP